VGRTLLSPDEVEVWRLCQIAEIHHTAFEANATRSPPG
jgi:hypothetical protein